MPALRCDSPDRNNHRPRHWGGAFSESAREEQVGFRFGQYTCCHFANAGVSKHICPCSVSSLAVVSHHLLTYFFTSVFQFVMAVDAVYARNTLQFLCLTYVFGSYQVVVWLTFRVSSIFNALFLLYAIIQIKEIRDYMADASVGGVSTIPIDVLTTIIPIVISIAEIAYICLGWKIYNEFGWKVYKFLGADRRIKKMYADYQIYECLVKFDVFFWAGFSVQFIWLVLQDTDWEYYVTFAALPLSIVLLVEGHLAARHENKWMMATFMFGCVGAMIYFIYKASPYHSLIF